MHNLDEKEINMWTLEKQVKGLVQVVLSFGCQEMNK